MNDADVAQRRDRILEEVLAHVDFDGLNRTTLDEALRGGGETPDLFERGLVDLLVHFSDWADRGMLARLEGIEPPFDDLRVRDKVAAAVGARLDILAPHKEAVRLAIGLSMSPRHAPAAARSAWRTADAIWVAAGDTATDFNHYSKRGILCGVLGSTMLAWLADPSEDHRETHAFLERRIGEALAVGGRLGRAAALGRLAEQPFRMAAGLRSCVRRGSGSGKVSPA